MKTFSALGLKPQGSKKEKKNENEKEKEKKNKKEKKEKKKDKKRIDPNFLKRRKRRDQKEFCYQPQRRGESAREYC